MPSKRAIALCALAAALAATATVQASKAGEPSSSEEDEAAPNATERGPLGFVNCEHVQRLFLLDGSLFKLGKVLDKCWHHGVTLDEIAAGTRAVSERPDIQNYGYDELYLPCQDVFASSYRKLTSRLLRDYVHCRAAKAVDVRIRTSMDWRFVDILEVFRAGNKSVKVSEETMVSCGNVTTKTLALLCRQYGLTEEQWRHGFFRYHYNDKWAVEEDVDELSLTCDQVFNARLHSKLYEDPVEQFVKCQRSLPINPEKRDLFEKKYAEELKEYRAYEASDTLVEYDLRGYVSCRHLLVESGASASWQSADKCRTVGLTYDEIRAGRDPPNEDDSMISEGNVAGMYLRCADVFNPFLEKFTSGLLGDYEACKDAGAISQQDIRAVQKRFSRLFKMFASNKAVKSLNVTEELVSCSNFTGRLADICRARGSTLAQEIRGFGSLARRLSNLWLNTEPLSRLFMRCEELFREATIKYIKSVPVDQYMHCRWTEALDNNQKAFIDKKIAKMYNNKHKVNETRYRGDADVEISSTILFD